MQTAQTYSKVREREGAREERKVQKLEYYRSSFFLIPAMLQR